MREIFMESIDIERQFFKNLRNGSMLKEKELPDIFAVDRPPISVPCILCVTYAESMGKRSMTGEELWCGQIMEYEWSAGEGLFRKSRKQD